MVLNVVNPGLCRTSLARNVLFSTNILLIIILYPLSRRLEASLFNRQRLLAII